MTLIKEIDSEDGKRKIEIYQDKDSSYFSFAALKLINNEENIQNPEPVWVPFRNSGKFETLQLLESFVEEEFSWLKK